jgi:hypothetical protein
MVGEGRHPILGVWSPDPVLSTVAPIGLAAAVGTALVVDLTHTRSIGGRTLADLVSDGPRLAELSPGRPGIAFLAGGTSTEAPASRRFARSPDTGQRWWFAPRTPTCRFPPCPSFHCFRGSWRRAHRSLTESGSRSGPARSPQDRGRCSPACEVGRCGGFSRASSRDAAGG